ncbi:hypothetical protein [Citrobacter freundii]
MNKGGIVVEIHNFHWCKISGVKTGGGQRRWGLLVVEVVSNICHHWWSIF